MDKERENWGTGIGQKVGGGECVSVCGVWGGGRRYGGLQSTTKGMELNTAGTMASILMSH